MKNKLAFSLFSLLTILSTIIGLSASSGMGQTSGAEIAPKKGILDQENVYYCDKTSYSYPTLVFRSDLGNARLIEFRTETFGKKWTPLERCRTIAKRAREFHRLRIISYLTLEDMEGTNFQAICISKYDADHADLLKEDPDFVRLLITLQQNDNGEKILDEIRGISSISSNGEPLIH
ncbi:MAG: hypothetical protein F6K40_28225 [Okeania sp. SIO3I5]|uniref:COP23 domain-containing protein n=1 Tax=Okeania sp. SIO3I5 TaxID=2607805 RepID=UPI0013B6F1C2|nr:COP23 domain-containing protein [Okeania sp. SIO3I5]NEQ39921.1 hypothetical protein [Okeania sp. SIO3I5]